MKKSFSDKPVSKDLVLEAMTYLKKSYLEGIDEFIVVENKKSKLYVQCIIVDDSFILQTPLHIDKDYYSLSELRDISFEDCKKIFDDFIDGDDISISYPFKTVFNTPTFELK